MSVENAVSINDLRAMARARLPRVVFDYLDGGAEDEVTLRANRFAFEQIRLKPRILSGGAVDLGIKLFDHSFAAPFMIGPTGLNGLYWADADLHLAEAASAVNAGFVLSTASNTSLETVAERATGPLWFQLYPWGKPDFSARLVERAAAAGYKAIIVTVDSLVGGKRERDMRHGFAHEIRMSSRTVVDGLRHPRWLASVWFKKGIPRFENLVDFMSEGATVNELAEFTRSQRNPDFSWADVAQIRKRWPGPLLIKGVMCAEDALRARSEGADGVIVSNHGGRQLDGAPATLEVLPEVARAVNSQVPILIDGGFRRGTDIVKALALGASAVLLGRATLYGVASGGRRGVDRALAILADEVRRTMLLIGCPSPAMLSEEHLALRR